MNPYYFLSQHFPLTIFLLVIALHGCGVAHVRTEVESSELHQYDKVFISEVKVYSLEEAAQGNAVLQAKMDEWAEFSRGELERYVNESHYQLIDKPPGINEKALIPKLYVDLAYGNRALRYWVGFGAGKGSVDSELTVTDNLTGDEKFRAVAESDLSVGGFGGDMQAVLKENIRQLVDQYPRVANEIR